MAVFARTRTLSTVTRAIRDYSPISRSAIVAHTDLTHAAISRAVSELLDDGIVVEKRFADTTGTQRKHGLQLNGEFGYALGIEYSPTSLRGAALDLANNQRLKIVEEVDLAARSRDERITLISDFSEKLLEAAKRTPGECVGIGIVDPGIVDRESGTTISSSLLDDWNNVPILEAIRSRSDLPVRLLGSGMAKVKAVDRLELPQPVPNLLYVEYGDGIACGLKLDGNYIAGSRNSAGELGHLKVSRDHRPCRCGGLDCLETHAALPAIIRKCQEALSANSRSALSGTETIDGVTVLQAAAKHDLLARHVVEDAFEMLGIAIAGVVSITNPQVLVLDGTLSLAGEEIRDHLLRVIRRSVLPDHWSALDVRFSGFDSFIGSVGGAVDLIDSLLEY